MNPAAPNGNILVLDRPACATPPAHAEAAGAVCSPRQAAAPALLDIRHAEYVRSYDGRDIRPAPSTPALICVPCGHDIAACSCSAPETRHPMWKGVAR